MYQAVKIFCYGSNLTTKRLKNRIGEFKLLGIVKLEGYKLLFHKISKDGSGKANIQHTNENADAVWGIVIEITNKQKDILDKYEGKGNGYNEVIIKVLLVNDIKVDVYTYVADKDKINNNLKPFNWYKALIVFGAFEHRFPIEYINNIRAVECIYDIKFERSDENWDIIKSALSNMP